MAALLEISDTMRVLLHCVSQALSEILTESPLRKCRADRFNVLVVQKGGNNLIHLHKEISFQRKNGLFNELRLAITQIIDIKNLSLSKEMYIKD